ncbi:hypothetical protein A0H81_02929 [Grifola frondosa]|uniref:Uncharacterized protein n=1 Tax=Grifola frondosa TaxID=5627 RepID=A0A1C7MPJ8_GRIFR|nr:hypothetical protein A0H81_02929 [Grifola frondosa]
MDLATAEQQQPRAPGRALICAPLLTKCPESRGWSRKESRYETLVDVIAMDADPMPHSELCTEQLNEAHVFVTYYNVEWCTDGSTHMCMFSYGWSRKDIFHPKLTFPS